MGARGPHWPCGSLDERVLDSFYDGMGGPQCTTRDTRCELLPLPGVDDGYRSVLMLGTTGAGKITRVRQLLGTHPETERFPSGRLRRREGKVMPGIGEAIRCLVLSSQHRSVTAPLPVEHWVGCPGRFRFGIPWPWEEHQQAASVVDSTGKELPNRPLAHVAAPRTDGASVSLIVWEEASPLDPDQAASSIGRQIASLYQGRLGRTQRLLLGGYRAVLVEVEAPQEYVGRLMSQWHAGSLHAEFRAPRAHVERYRPDFNTILGTWTWD